MRRLDTLALPGLTLEGVADGGVETCIQVPELGLMFDLGMVPEGALKYGTLLATHGHADHLGGIAYYVSQRGLMNLSVPDIHVPAEIEAPLRTILDAWSSIEGFDLRYELHPRRPGDEFPVRRDLVATTLRTTHRVPSLAYVIQRVSHKLDPKYAGRPGPELAELRKRGVAISHERREPILCVTGDTQIELFREHELVRRTRVLVHEVTSWDERRGVDSTRKWGHTHIEEMIEAAEQFEGEALVLVHRSLRHSRAQAERVVAERFPATVRAKIHVFGA